MHLYTSLGKPRTARKRQIYRQTDMHTDRYIDRHTYRQTDRQRQVDMTYCEVLHRGSSVPVRVVLMPGSHNHTTLSTTY